MAGPAAGHGPDMADSRLRRSDCAGPGISRHRRGRGFSYHWPDGRRVDDPAVLERIRALAVPPAWTEVWICPWPNGHLQAVGTDAAGRRQYRYHDRWRERRDREKFERVLELGRIMPRVRRVVAADLGRPGLERRRVLGACVRLLDVASFRVGGEEYAEEHDTYGLATLLPRHARVHGEVVAFDYVAKSGQHRRIEVTDPTVAAVVAACKRRRGLELGLLAWKEGRRWVDVRSDDVNAYVKEVAGPAFSAKDFRTWNATVLAAVGLAGVVPVPASARGRRRAVRAVIGDVAAHLGNTPAVCRQAYVDPRVVERFWRGQTIGPALARPLAPAARRRAAEAAVLSLLGDDAAAAEAA